MGKLELVGESREAKIETKKTPAEVLEMDAKLIARAKELFSENSRLAAEAINGLGARKDSEVSREIAECLETTKKAVQFFKQEREKCFPSADNYKEKLVA